MTKQLGDFFADLSYGVFANLSIGSEGNGSIKAESESRVVGLTNSGLKRLYSRFLLLERELTIRCIEDRTLYPLEIIHADSDDTIGVDKFIVDTIANPYIADVIKILMAYNPLGEEVPENDLGDDNSIFYPAADVIQLPLPVADEEWNFLYQAEHGRLGVDDLSQLIYLPEPLYEALEAYVGYRVFSSMNGQEHTQKASELLQRYENICLSVEARDLAKNSIQRTHTKFEARGFA